MKKLLKLLIPIVLMPLIVKGQEDSVNNKSNGSFSGHMRSFFMSTINKADLSDYYAFAVGAGTRFESPERFNFKIVISGFFIYNLGSSDLGDMDSITNAPNRYEIGLFDIKDPENSSDLDRLEELFIQYRFRESSLRLGKMILKTPFVNAQDGRMRPTVEEGIWLDVRQLKHISFQAGWITGISPRSTVNWYSVGKSIGVYPGGVDENGVKSNYSEQLTTKGLGLFGVTYKRNSIRVIFWETFIENISSTALVQAELERKSTSSTSTYYSGVQLVRQDAIGNGGSNLFSNRYIKLGSISNAVSVRLGWKNALINLNLNSTLMTGDRFLMPREWGRDPFYTFLPRERNEGFGEVRAISFNATMHKEKSSFSSSLGIGTYTLPGVRNYSLNKYAMPSYHQINLELRYNLGKVIKGADLQFLFVKKIGIGQGTENPKNVINKVDMSQFNLVFNYHFTSK